jgi:aspartate ammonia-lyase
MNAPRGYRHVVVRRLNELTNLDLTATSDLRESMQSQLPVAAVSSALRNLAIELTRITNDLRLLASGPQTGLAEIILPAVQPGSSIMPGKVNPSMLECMNQVCFHIIGSATAVDYAVQAGQLDLNVMMPLMTFEILFSTEILKNYLPVFIAKCIAGIEADRAQCEAYYISSPSLATALNPIIGYEKAAAIAKRAYKENRPVLEIALEDSGLGEAELRKLLDPAALTKGGIHAGAGGGG